MKPTLRLLLFSLLLTSYSVNAQSDYISIYLDKNELECTRKTDAKSIAKIRLSTERNVLDSVYVYYLDGNIKSKGTYLKYVRGIKHGEMTHYYKNGTLAKKETYNKGVLIVEEVEYYPNGQLKLIKMHPFNSKNVEIKNAWNKEGKQTVLDGKGVLDYISWDGIHTAKGKVKNGNKVGEWIGKNNLLSFTYTEKYDAHGKLMSGVSIKNQKEFTYFQLTEEPKHEKGKYHVYRSIAHVIKYPREAKNGEVKGKVYTRMYISEKGDAYNFKVVEGIGPRCDKEAFRVISLVFKDANMIPAKTRGVAFESVYIFPLSFKVGLE
ncbi:energy transducer TonB [Flammeovirga yaeyamensis]|uniref:Energy transducer TonB n=1 Tax=Flammeovirga yaeyamensis TaxID=367791 RepID=A0AAX1N8Y3_9BACT|nr:energy transducer TonB [Flammeovirga yaeyamensis]MBB3697434.1 antitoxin component YwqK of YwqJK toxin-antitoxin module [Flammeovirga yaeyamensis]NMF36128.1 hypothetical protein [Flammeovirga yaeyamensis]QWG02861.1 energy transducer TonB [Flammeovirga yaeyamensis]